MKAIEWIERVKSAKGLQSDYAAAKILGIGRQVLSNYRARNSTLDDEMALKVAEAIGERPELVLLDQMIERSKSPEARNALGGVLQRLGGTMCGVALTVGLWGGSPAPAEAGQAVIEDAPPVYIMSNHIAIQGDRLVGLPGPHSSWICARSRRWPLAQAFGPCRHFCL